MKVGDGGGAEPPGVPAWARCWAAQVSCRPWACPSDPRVHGRAAFGHPGLTACPRPCPKLTSQVDAGRGESPAGP